MYTTSTLKFMPYAQATVRRYENGDTEPVLSALIKIAKFHKVSLDYLAGIND